MSAFELISTLVVLACIAGCVSFFRKKPRISGLLGVATIVLAAFWFALRVVSFALTKEGLERVVLTCAGVIGALLVSIYWLRFWQQKRPDR